MDGQTNGRMDGWTDRQTDKQTDGQMNKPTEKVTYRGRCPTQKGQISLDYQQSYHSQVVQRLY